MGDNQARLEDTGQGRVEAMDAAGIDVSILSVVTPATQALPAREGIPLARDANDEATSAVRAHPDSFRAFATSAGCGYGAARCTGAGCGVTGWPEQLQQGGRPPWRRAPGPGRRRSRWRRAR
jgi:hypothetical protein